MSRGSALSSNGVECVAEEKRVVETAKENEYPLNFINRHAVSRPPAPAEGYQRPPRTSLTLPYIGGLSDAIRMFLAPLDIKVALGVMCGQQVGTCFFIWDTMQLPGDAEVVVR